MKSLAREISKHGSVRGGGSNPFRLLDSSGCFSISVISMRLYRRVIEAVSEYATSERIRFVSVTVLVITLLLLVTMFVTAKDRKTIFGPELGADYANLYVAAMILNSESPEKLYDLELQGKLYHELFPQVSADESLPYPYAPFLASFLRPLALLPYEWSYLIASIVEEEGG